MTKQDKIGHYWCHYRVGNPGSGSYCCACESHDCPKQTIYSRHCAGYEKDLSEVEWQPQNIKKDLEDNFIKKI